MDLPAPMDIPVADGVAKDRETDPTWLLWWTAAKRQNVSPGLGGGCWHVLHVRKAGKGHEVSGRWKSSRFACGLQGLTLKTSNRPNPERLPLRAFHASKTGCAWREATRGPHISGLQSCLASHSSICLIMLDGFGKSIASRALFLRSSTSDCCLWDFSAAAVVIDEKSWSPSSCFRELISPNSTPSGDGHFLSPTPGPLDPERAEERDMDTFWTGYMLFHVS